LLRYGRLMSFVLLDANKGLWVAVDPRDARYASSPCSCPKNCDRRNRPPAYIVYPSPNQFWAIAVAHSVLDEQWSMEVCNADS